GRLDTKVVQRWRTSGDAEAESPMRISLVGRLGCRDTEHITAPAVDAAGFLLAPPAVAELAAAVAISVWGKFDAASRRGQLVAWPQKPTRSSDPKLPTRTSPQAPCTGTRLLLEHRRLSPTADARTGRHLLPLLGKWTCRGQSP